MNAGIQTFSLWFVKTLKPGSPLNTAGIRNGLFLWSLERKSVILAAPMTKRAIKLEKRESILLVLGGKNLMMVFVKESSAALRACVQRDHNLSTRGQPQACLESG